MDRVTGYVQGIAGGRLEVDCALVSRGDAADGVRIQFTTGRGWELPITYRGILRLSDVHTIGPTAITKNTCIDMKTHIGTPEDRAKLIVQSMMNCSNSMLGNDHREIKVRGVTLSICGVVSLQYIISWDNILTHRSAPLQIVLEKNADAVPPNAVLANTDAMPPNAVPPNADTLPPIKIP